MSLSPAVLKKRQEAWLKIFRSTGRILAACRKAGISKETVRLWRRDDPDFQKRFEEADLDVTEMLEDSYVQKAMRADGEKACWNLLKARRPEKYRETSNVNLTTPVPLNITLSDDRGADAPPS